MHTNVARTSLGVRSGAHRLRWSDRRRGWELGALAGPTTPVWEGVGLEGLSLGLSTLGPGLSGPMGVGGREEAVRAAGVACIRGGGSLLVQYLPRFTGVACWHVGWAVRGGRPVLGCGQVPRAAWTYRLGSWEDTLSPLSMSSSPLLTPEGWCVSCPLHTFPQLHTQAPDPHPIPLHTRHPSQAHTLHICVHGRDVGCPLHPQPT